MPREKEDYRENLMALYEKFGRDTVFVTLHQVALLLKKDARTLRADKTFPIKHIGGRYEVPIISLARWLS